MRLQYLILLLAVYVKAQYPLDEELDDARFWDRPSAGLDEVFRWKQVDFQFPNNSIRSSLIRSKRFIQANNNILGIEVWRDKLFLTVPRWFYGTGSALNYVKLNNGNPSPLLIPYPDYDTNDIYNGNLENKIVSTTRIFVDSCNRLWVLDNGQENIFGDVAVTLTSHKILVYDLTTDRLIRKVVIGNDAKNALSLFYEIVVDINNNRCDTAYAYIADTIGYGLLVYSWETNTLRRVSNAYFYFEPQSSVFGDAQFHDGVMGLALSSQNPDGFKTLYFHALASTYEYNVSTRVLKNPNLSSNFKNFNFMGSRGEDRQSTNARFDAKTGVVFYTLVKEKGIGCWNSKNAGKYNYRTNAVAVADKNRITFPSSLTLDSQRNVWVLSNSILGFATQTLDPNEYNYRVFKTSADKLIQYNACSRRY